MGCIRFRLCKLFASGVSFYDKENVAKAMRAQSTRIRSANALVIIIFHGRTLKSALSEAGGGGRARATEEEVVLAATGGVLWVSLMSGICEYSLCK